MRIAEGSVRDIPATLFTSILERLTRATPSIWAVTLVDPMGETVDYAGEIPPFSIQLAGSHMQIVAAAAARLRSLSPTKSIIVRTTDQTLIAECLPESYVLVLLGAPDLVVERINTAIARCVAAVCEEAGWPLDGASFAPLSDYFSNSSN